MKVSKLISFLQDLEGCGEYEVCLSRVMSMHCGEEFYEVVLCAPLVGIFIARDEGEVRMMLENSDSCVNFGKVERFSKEVLSLVGVDKE